VSPDKPQTARQAAAEQTRQKLLAAAVAEFSRRPYAEVTVAGIAGAAGVAHGLVSHHFQGKQGAYAAAMEAVSEQLREAEDAGAADGPAGDELRRRFGRFLVFVADHQATALNLILATGRDEAFIGRRKHGLLTVAGLLGLDPADPAVTAALNSFADAAEGLTIEWLTQGRPFAVDAVADAFCTLLAGAVRGAHALDPSLDVTAALAQL
jgi:AcrR family transcriptional regulator